MEENVPVTRRKFLDRLLSLTGIGALGLVVYPMLRFILPPKQAEADNISKTVMEVGGLSKEDYKIFEFNRKPAILIRTGTDPNSTSSYHALSAVCTHLQCTVQYDKSAGQIWCACHNGRFTLTGKVISGPPPRPLPVFDVDILNKKIIVSHRNA